MKRTMLLVASVLVAALGTGTVAIWALQRSAERPVREVRAPVGPGRATATPTAAPTTVGPGEKGLAVTLAGPGLAPGQWIDLAATAEGGRAEMLLRHVPVLQVLADGRVVLGLTEQAALDVLTKTSHGEVLTALLPGPDGAAQTEDAPAGPAGAATGSPTAPDEASSIP